MTENFKFPPKPISEASITVADALRLDTKFLEISHVSIRLDNPEKHLSVKVLDTKSA